MKQLPGTDKNVVPAAYTEVPYSGGYDPAAEPETGGLIEYWRILRRRKGSLILIAFIGALIGFLATIPQTPIYQAKTSVEISDLNTNFLNLKQADPISESSADTSDLQTQVKI